MEVILQLVGNVIGYFADLVVWLADIAWRVSQQIVNEQEIREFEIVVELLDCLKQQEAFSSSTLAQYHDILLLC